MHGLKKTFQVGQAGKVVNFENGSDQNLLLSHHLTTLTFVFYLNAPSRETHPPLAMQESVRGPETCPHLNDENEEASRGILRYVSNHLSQWAAALAGWLDGQPQRPARRTQGQSDRGTEEGVREATGADILPRHF